MYRGWHALGTFLCSGRSAPCTFLDKGWPALGTQGYQPWVQDGNSGLTALGTFLYWRQPALCTFLDQGRQAPGTQGYQPSVQHGNSGLVTLRYISVMEAARPMYFSGPRAASPGYKNVPRFENFILNYSNMMYLYKGC